MAWVSSPASAACQRAITPCWRSSRSWHEAGKWGPGLNPDLCGGSLAAMVVPSVDARHRYAVAVDNRSLVSVAAGKGGALTRLVAGCRMSGNTDTGGPMSD